MRFTKKICHLTSVHPRYDIRIFLKECCSLAKAGYSVSLIVADGKGDKVKDSINIYDVGASNGRINRMTKTIYLVFRKAKELNADIYHFHDPELIPIGLRLKRLGKKVIYDVHEDVPRQTLYKTYIAKPIRYLVAKFIELVENYAGKRFHAIVTATPYIRDRFLKINPNTVDVNNFPILDELYVATDWDVRDNGIVYVGGISKERGIVELIKSLEYTDTTLHLAGDFESEGLYDYVSSMDGWKKVKYYGYVDRTRVKEILNRVKIGIVTLNPIINYLDAFPVKLFEYMSASLPVIASNFPLWREIIEGNGCGICVDPLKPEEIAQAIEWLIKHPVEAKKMGENGRKAVLEKYNWENESEKLLKVYEELYEE